MHEPSPGPEMPEPKRPRKGMCNFQTVQSDECFETQEEACASMGCTTCDFPYEMTIDGKARMACSSE